MKGKLPSLWNCFQMRSACEAVVFLQRRRCRITWLPRFHNQLELWPSFTFLNASDTNAPRRAWSDSLALSTVRSAWRCTAGSPQWSVQNTRSRPRWRSRRTLDCHVRLNSLNYQLKEWWSFIQYRSRDPLEATDKSNEGSRNQECTWKQKVKVLMCLV